MLNKKIMYILTLFIILSLSMNTFSAIDFDDIQLQPGDTVWLVGNDNGEYMIQIDTQADYGQGEGEDDTPSDDTPADDGTGDGTGDGQGDTQTGDNQNANGNGSNGNGNTNFNFGNMTGGNKSGGGGFDFGNLTGGNRSGSSFSFNLSDILAKFLGGGDSNSTNATNATNSTPESKVTDVPAVVSSANYQPVSSSNVEKISQHIIKRTRDNKIVSEGDTLRLDGINKLYDSDFTKGHLLVYVDGKLVFNEITSDDLSTPILGITDDLVGQHVISIEFTPDGDSNINKYTENVTVI